LHHFRAIKLTIWKTNHLNTRNIEVSSSSNGLDFRFRYSDVDCGQTLKSARHLFIILCLVG
jgi:hypothetical protein